MLSVSKMNTNKCPCNVQPLDANANEKIKSLMLGSSDGSVQVGPDKYVFRYKYGEAAEGIYNFKVRRDDVWIVTYPRSGTTLTQEMMWLAINDDYETATNISLDDRFPFLEYTTFPTDDDINKIKSRLSNDEERLSIFLDKIKPQWEVLENAPGRRFIKTHIPLSLLPPNLLTSGAKVVYIARNPKNVAISRYHQESTLAGFTGDFETYWDLFQNDLLVYSPYWKHLEEAWRRRNERNLLFLFYEDIVKDYRKAIVELSEFLEAPVTDEQISKMEKFLDIDTFRKVQHRTDNLENFFLPPDAGAYQHVRIGKSGNWSDYFTEELNKRANKWIRENYKNTTLRFPIELF